MSDLQIIDVEQGSEAWHAARLGIPTASMFATVMASGRGGGESKMRRKYMLRLVGERITGQPQESYSNAHMERGKEMEAEARELYALVSGNNPELVGFMRRGQVGASPDSLIGDDGLLEIKTKQPDLQIEVLLANRLPPEHEAQVQGQLWVSGRSWCDFASYWPGLPIFVHRVERNERRIAEIAVAVEQFNQELEAVLAQLAVFRSAA